MGIGPIPPQVDLVKEVARFGNVVVFEGTNTNDGSSVEIIHRGTPEYFKGVKRFKVTFDPIPEDK